MSAINNINAVLDEADQIDWQEGILAYGRYNQMMERIAAYYLFPLDRVTAAFVSLSPNNDYKGNLRSLVSVLAGVADGVDVSRIRVSTYNQCRDRAYAYASGQKDFLQCTKGAKIRSFYQNILDPLNWGPVTVDGHMLSVYLGVRLRMKEAVRYKWSYESVAHAVREVAFMRCLLPHHVQAITWFAWKRKHKVLMDDQLDLFGFMEQDQNGTLWDVTKIKGYGRYDHESLLRSGDNAGSSADGRGDHTTAAHDPHRFYYKNLWEASADGVA